MPPDVTTPGLDSGTRAEVRVAQAWFWDGYFVRRGVDLQHKFGSEVSTVTDLDVIGYTFDDSLVQHKYIGEVKTGKAKGTPRALDRALWMSGLRELVNAERGEVTTAFPTSITARDACQRLGVTVQHLDDLANREQRLNIPSFDDVGSQGQTIAELRRRVQFRVKSEAPLQRGYWFLTTEVWFLEPFDALKRTLGLIRELSKMWPAEGHPDATETIQWFFAEAISIAALNLTLVAGQATTMDTVAFEETASAQLASGDLPYYGVLSLSERFDDYLGKVLASLDAPPEIQISAMGAFRPTPPDYAEPLLELIFRLSKEARQTSRLPRQLDAVVFERLVRQREPAPEVRRRLALTPHVERQFRLVAAFLRGQFSLPQPVLDSLTSPLSNRGQLGNSIAEPALFESLDPRKDSPPDPR